MLQKKTQKVKVNSEQQMLSLGKNLYHQLKPHHSLILIEGPIGAGKTVFVKGIISAKNDDVTMVTSPSFAHKNLYSFNQTNFYHYDFYLMKSFTKEFISNLLADKDEGIVLIEWANLYPDLYKLKSKVVVTITPINETTRTVTIKR